MIDVVMLVFLFLMIALGKFGDPPEGTDEDQLARAVYGDGPVLDEHEFRQLQAATESNDGLTSSLAMRIL